MTTPRWAQKAILYAVLAALLVGAVAIVVGCGPAPQTAPVPAGYPVEDSDACIDINRCPAFDHYRRFSVDPSLGVIYWAVTNHGQLACPVPAAVFTMLRTGVLLRCDWRAYRP